jgi:hypothetical protein
MEHDAGLETKFTCAACGSQYDREAAVAECRMCHRSYCDQCIDEQGVCTPCGVKE